MILVTSSFLAALAASTWSDNHVLTSDGPRWLRAASGSWALGPLDSAAVRLHEDLFALLVVSTATSTGKVRTPSGAEGELLVSSDASGALAVLDLPTGPIGG